MSNFQLSEFKKSLSKYFDNFAVRAHELISDHQKHYLPWLIFLFSVVYLPLAFLLVEDLGLISAFEVDPASHISAVESLLKTYNMHESYHSKYYGWTYFGINFFLLVPIKLFTVLFGIESNFFLYFGIRFILFSIGLASLVAFYYVIVNFFKSHVIAFIAGLLYVFNSVGYKYFYIIHPETTGILFIFLAVLALQNFVKNPDNLKIYYWGLVALVLASLSKQIFFIVSLPILFSYLVIYLRGTKQSFLKFISSAKGRKVFGNTCLIAFTILVIVHPFAIIQIHKFIDFQLQFRMFVDGEFALSKSEAYQEWLKVISNNIILVISYIVSIPGILIAIHSYRREKNINALLYIINAISLLIVTFIIMTGNRLFINPTYFQPIYPFVLINLFAAALYINKQEFLNSKIFIRITNYLLVYGLFFFLAFSLYEQYPQYEKRIKYKESAAFKSYDYVKQNIGPSDLVAHDHFVAIPDKLKDQACHYWQGCGRGDRIEEFAPNYVMLNEAWEINNTQPKETARLQKYVKDHSLDLVKTIGTNNIEISVYKRED